MFETETLEEMVLEGKNSTPQYFRRITPSSWVEFLRNELF